ncbi:hypothetical protein [Roseovarius spongiae]|uniref:hypothetical protein n=1 Tax=Roseovarius spongiae TaxID=2320272 RepID=UPI0011C3A2AD|nr:hypothetical protein [Roseovarius spongiae]
MKSVFCSIVLGGIAIASPSFSQEAKDLHTAIAYYAFRELKAMPVLTNRTVVVGDVISVSPYEEVLAPAADCYLSLRTKPEQEDGARSGRTHHVKISVDIVGAIAGSADVRRIVTAEAALEALFKNSSAVVFSGVTGSVPDPSIQELFPRKVENIEDCRPTLETLAQHRYDRLLVTRTYSGSIDAGFVFERGTSTEISAATDVIGRFFSDASVTVRGETNSNHVLLGKWENGVIAVQSSRLNLSRLAEAWLVMNENIDTVIGLEGLVQEYLQNESFEIREGIRGAIRNQLEEWGFYGQDFENYRRQIFAGEEGSEYSPEDIPEEHWRAAAALAAAILIASENV